MHLSIYFDFSPLNLFLYLLNKNICNCINQLLSSNWLSNTSPDRNEQYELYTKTNSPKRCLSAFIAFLLHFRDRVSGMFWTFSSADNANIRLCSQNFFIIMYFNHSWIKLLNFELRKFFGNVSWGIWHGWTVVGYLKKFESH
jgi:hypothetical protein